MKDLLDFTVKYLSEGNVLIILIGIVIGIAFNLNKIFSFFDERKKAKLANINDAIASDYIDDKTKEFFKEELVLEHFRLVKGFGLEKNLREAAITIHKEAKGELGFIHFKRGIEHLQMVDGELSVRLTWLHKAAFLYNVLVSIFFALGAMTFFILPIFIDDISLLTSIKYYAFALSSFLLAAFFILQIRSVISAKYIKDEIQKQSIANE